MPDLTYQSLPLSNLDRIDRVPKSDRYPPLDIFGPEPKHTWCFYYQKADLARQFDDWQEVTRLWSKAQKNDFRPGSGAEFIVFIEGFAHSNDWERARAMTLDSNKYGNNIRPALCEVWDNFVVSTEPSLERENAAAAVFEKLDCKL